MGEEVRAEGIAVLLVAQGEGRGRIGVKGITCTATLRALELVGQLREVALTKGLYPSEASLIAGAVRVGVDALLDGLVGGRGAVKEVVEVLPVALLILDAEACREGEGTSSGIQTAAPIQAQCPLKGALQGVLREVAGVDTCGGSILQRLGRGDEGALIAPIA